MRKALLRRHPLINLPFNAFIYEVNEVGVLRVDQVSEILGAWLSDFALAVGANDRSVVFVEEDFFALRSANDTTWRHSLHLHHQGHVIFFVLTRE